MPRLRIAAVAIAAAALGIAPATAQAAVTSSQITTPGDGAYLMSLDNTPTTVDVKGTSNGTAGDPIDVVCFYDSPTQAIKLKGPFAVGTGGAFDTGAVPLKPIAGHACRLRAVPAGDEPGGDENSSFAGPRVAVSEAELPVAVVGGPNAGTAYNFYVNGVTFTGFAAWTAAGTPGGSMGSLPACGGPDAAPIDSSFDIGNFAIDCAGSLLGDDLGAWGGRSEVQIDGRNAYDAASAQALFPRTHGFLNGSEDLTGFPALSAHVDFDPTSGLGSSHSSEQWVGCTGPDLYKPTSVAACPSFASTGVQLERDITTSDGGAVVTMTDTWSSTDGAAHTLDLLYDDFVGLGTSTVRGYQFPGQNGFFQYGSGASVPGPTAAPGSILVRTNVTAPDGDPAEAAGAITYATAPTGYHFATGSEFEEHHVLQIPAGGSASLSYVYSVGYTVGAANRLALAGRDHFQAPAVAISPPAGGATVSSSSVQLSGSATAGSGITSLVVGGQSVPVGSGGAWSATVPLNPGSNTITASATDGAGATVQAQVTVVYQPPPPPSAPVRCKVPRIKNMKLAKAERALRRAHCRVGKIRRVRSGKIGRGRVMSTTPRAGRRLPAGTKVELFVSKGAEGRSH